MIKSHRWLTPGQQLLSQPFVVAGPDVGFRVVRWDGQIPVGQVVVRINGAWVAALLMGMKSVWRRAVLLALLGAFVFLLPEAHVECGEPHCGQSAR